VGSLSSPLTRSIVASVGDRGQMIFFVPAMFSKEIPTF
jgi:hypothetical protein